MNQEYHLIGNPEIKKKKYNFSVTKTKRLILILCLLILPTISLFVIYFNNLKVTSYIKFKKNDQKYFVLEEIDNNYLFIKGNSRKDKYGLELNVNILNGIYNIGFNNDIKTKIEDNKLYTPPCPYLHPVHYPDSIINPQCEKSSLQIVNYNRRKGRGLPHSLPLDSITNQIKKWKEWEKSNIKNISYIGEKVAKLVNKDYHPFDYGYRDSDMSSDLEYDDVDFYSKVITSRMDEVPDPRKRRLFSFVLFNGEFDLLDLHLSEYYEIVDYFVIYESNTTFTGNPKPLYFTRTLLETDRYKKFEDKLIPLPCESIVDEDNGRGKAFPREHLARRTLIEKGLRSVQARHGDIYMHGDLDELPKTHILSRLKKCGGWEHLQAGIGGGPKSFIDGNVESYFVDDNTSVKTNELGEYLVDYQRDDSLGFLSWFHEYSMNIVQDSRIGTFAHPNIAIFDARRSLGQFNERSNSQKFKRSYEDPLLDPNFDPYQGYTYTDNTNDKKTGKGFLGEKVRFATSKIALLEEKQQPVFWNGGWHFSSFLPTIDQFLNKVYSYSHFKDYKHESDDELKKDIIDRIKNHYYIFGKKKKYHDNTIQLPDSYSEGYQYNFDYKYWHDNSKLKKKTEEFSNYIKLLSHEIPNQVWKNPICYSFMIDRDFGLEKKLWWQVIPKEEWKTVRFETLNETIIDEIIPSVIPKSFRIEMFEAMEKENY
eukprot:jgi/Orpsp1_1/1186766/evm.model.d7180000053157.1